MARADTTRGFTLLEVLVAVAVLGLALVSLLGLHVRNIDLIARDQRITEATLLARGLMAEVDAAPFPDLGVTEGDFEVDYPERYPDLRWEREVVRLPAGRARGARPGLSRRGRVGRRRHPHLLRAATMRRGRRGFTLLEVMVALGIFGLVAVTLYGTFSRTLRSKALAEEHAEVTRIGRAAVNRMADEIGSAFYPRSLSGTAIFRVLRGGTDEAPLDTLMFTALSTRPAGLEGRGHRPAVHHLLLRP